MGVLFVRLCVCCLCDVYVHIAIRRECHRVFSCVYFRLALLIRLLIRSYAFVCCFFLSSEKVAELTDALDERSMATRDEHAALEQALEDQRKHVADLTAQLVAKGKQ